ncbi:MAG: DUF1778 domain-containing protein [Mycobacteriales bacterium]
MRGWRWPRRYGSRFGSSLRARRDWSARLNWRRSPVSDFVRSAVEERAEQVLRDHDVQTAVPADFFDDLLAALDAPAEANAALTRAAQRAQRVVRR